MAKCRQSGKGSIALAMPLTLVSLPLLSAVALGGRWDHGSALTWLLPPLPTPPDLLRSLAGSTGLVATSPAMAAGEALAAFCLLWLAMRAGRRSASEQE